MRTHQERYFISYIIFPFLELSQLLSNNGHIPVYFDDQYSQPKEKIRNLCVQVLNIFEQPEFVNSFGAVTGKDKRNELNANDPAFHRILSHAIKVKHGVVNNQFYADTELYLPLNAFYYESEKKYDYKYAPIIKMGNEEFCFFKDLEHVVKSLVSLYTMRIEYPQISWTTTPRYAIKDGVMDLNLLDSFNFFDEEMTVSTQIKTFKLVDSSWTPANLDIEIGWKLLVKQ